MLLLSSGRDLLASERVAATFMNVAALLGMGEQVWGAAAVCTAVSLAEREFLNFWV